MNCTLFGAPTNTNGHPMAIPEASWFIAAALAFRFTVCARANPVAARRYTAVETASPLAAAAPTGSDRQAQAHMIVSSVCTYPAILEPITPGKRMFDDMVLKAHYGRSAQELSSIAYARSP